MKHAVLASLALAFAVPATASARRLPEPMPTEPVTSAKACRAAGLPLFEIRHRSEVKAPTSTLSVYSSGAWVNRTADENGKPGRVTRGCLDRSDVATIRSSLRTADWDVTHMRIACLAYAPDYTEYVVRGRVMFHDQICSGAVLDETSRASIAAIEAVLPRL